VVTFVAVVVIIAVGRPTLAGDARDANVSLSRQGFLL